MFSDKQVQQLAAPLHPDTIKTRQQSGRNLSYIEGWHAINEANRIFGFGAWDRETVEIRCVTEKPRKIGKGQYERDGWAVTYIAKVRVKVSEAIIREGCGAGHGIDVDLGLAHESAIKEAETDAMKRALMTFGNPFGLALYDKEQREVGEAPRQATQKPATTEEPSAVYLNAIDEAKSHDTKASLRQWWASVGPGLKQVIDPSEYSAVFDFVKQRAADLPENNQTDKDAA